MLAVFFLKRQFKIISQIGKIFHVPPSQLNPFILVALEYGQLAKADRSMKLRHISLIAGIDSVIVPPGGFLSLVGILCQPVTGHQLDRFNHRLVF